MKNMSILFTGGGTSQRCKSLALKMLGMIENKLNQLL